MLILGIALITIVYLLIYNDIKKNKISFTIDNKYNSLSSPNKESKENIEKRLFYLEEIQVEFIHIFSKLNKENKEYIKTKMHNHINDKHKKVK